MAGDGKFVATSKVWYPLEGQWQWTAANRIPEFQAMFHALEQAAVRAAEVEAAEIRRRGSEGALRPAITIAIGGGKGGIGKTSVTAGLGLCLAALGQSVIIVDCDLGGASLRTELGLPETNKSSVDFFIHQQATVEELLMPTGIDRLQLISGQPGVLGLANPLYSQKLRFINQLRKLKADFVLLDLGAGAAYNILDFFLCCDRGIVLTCPTPASVKYTFGFLKTAAYRGIAKTLASNSSVRRGLEHMAARSFRPTMFQFLAELETESQASAESVRRYLSERSWGLLLNMVMRREELGDAARLISEVSRKVGLGMDFLGFLPYDQSLRRAVRKSVPFVVDDPKSKISRDILQIAAEKLLMLRNRHDWEDRVLYNEAIRQLKGFEQRLPKSIGRPRERRAVALEPAQRV
jgi:flagellar biosynthesis protein FlhG